VIGLFLCPQYNRMRNWTNLKASIKLIRFTSTNFHEKCSLTNNSIFLFFFKTYHIEPSSRARVKFSFQNYIKLAPYRIVIISSLILNENTSLSSTFHKPDLSTKLSIEVTLIVIPYVNYFALSKKKTSWSNVFCRN
jgi:hypothetical protein